MPSSELPWQSIVDAVVDGVVLFDADGAIVEVNEAFALLVGRSSSEIRETSAATWWDRAAVAAACAQARRDGRASVSVTLTPRQGETRSVAIALRALPLRSGWTVGTVRDDDIVRELERSQQRWRSIAENPFDFVVIIGPDYRFQYVNHVAPGLTPEDLIGKRTPFDFVSPEHHPAMRAAYERAFCDGRPQAYDTYVPLVDRWFSTIVGPIVEDGKVLACSLLTRDITEGMRAIQAVRQNEQRLELAIEGSEVGIFEIDLATRKPYFSPRVHEMLGLRDQASLNEHLDAFTAQVHSDDRERASAAFEHAVRTDEPFDQIYRIRTASGEERWLRGRGRTVRDGATQRFSGFVADVTEQVRADTERRKLEERVQHVHRLETLGTVASGIAHEFNNLLVPMLGNAEHARAALAAGRPITEEIDELVQAGHRARDLVARILVFSRPHVAVSGQIDVVAVVREATALVRASLPPTLELVCRLPANRPLIAGDDGQLHQTIVNLCTNARQASGNRAGRIQVIVEPTSIEAADARRLEIAAGAVLKLTVADDGPGIAADVIGRVFDPFFTTQPVGEGTGLGLWIVHQIVRAQCGAITVTSTPGHGARFELWVPMLGDRDARVHEPQAAKPLPSEPRRILFVEDEAQVRSITTRTLRAMAHNVVAVDSAETALRQIAADPTAFDLVLTDQSMPGLTGVGLASRLATLAPGLPIVIITGLGGFTGTLPANVIEVVAKPWTRDELAAAVAKATSVLSA
jgi:PAS domain S-box-containing protein